MHTMVIQATVKLLGSITPEVAILLRTSIILFKASRLTKYRKFKTVNRTYW